MATAFKNLSEFNSLPQGNFSGMKVGVVVAEWNKEITEKLLKGALDALKKYGVWDNNVEVYTVPGSYELTFGSHVLAQASSIDGVIALGCVIKGETKHDEYICNAVAQGLTNVSLQQNKPTIFGLLTTNTMQQAKDRSGGKHGNKGEEAAVTLLKMLEYKL